MVGYALDAELARKTFWTFSVWEDRASLDAFAASDPHRVITRRLQPLMEPTRFEFFQIPGSDLPMTWDEMKAPVCSHAAPAAPGRGTAAGGGTGGYGRRGDQEFLTEGDGVIGSPLRQSDSARRSGPDQADPAPARSLAGAADLR